MTDKPETDVPSGRSDTPAEPRSEPDKVTDADRAANPLGVARREREQAERHRDEAGKFARKEGEKDKPDEQQGKQQKPEAKRDGDKPDGKDKGGEPQDPGTVPHQALAEERRRRQSLERQIAELMQRPPAPAQVPQAPQQQPQPEQNPLDQFFVNPKDASVEWARGVVDPVNQRLQKVVEHQSHLFAKQTYGAEAVTGALDALRSHLQVNPNDAKTVNDQLSQSMDPVGDVVRWHKQQTTMQKFGADPEAYIKAEVERRFAELQQQNGGERHDPPPAPPRPPQQPLPTSFAAQPGGGPRGGGYGGPKALSEMLPRG